MEHLFQFYSTDFSEFPIIDSAEPAPVEDSDYCEEIMRDGKKYHSCTFPNCGKVFRFKSEFMRHKLTHVPQRPLDCPYAGCTKTFKREDALKNHLRIHTGELPFQCDIPGCDQSFPTKAGLRYHMLKHKGQKECRCSFPGCNKTFLTMSQLKQHESALNYHQKMSTQTKAVQPQEEPEEKPQEKPQPQVQSSKTEKVKDMYLDEFFAPEAKPAGNLEWGIKDQNDNDNREISEDLQSNFEKMVKVILTENNVMKKRLNMCTTLMDLMQENNDLRTKLNKTPELEDPFSAPQEFSDDKIFSFLNFDDQDKKTSFY